MNDDDYPWKVKVTYSRQLIELARVSQEFDRIDCILAVVKAAERLGGRPAAHLFGRHAEERGDFNVEHYEFAVGLKVDSFAQEVQRVFDNCANGQLQRAVALQAAGVVGQCYQFDAEMRFVGQVGGHLKMDG